jgi:hypothetical protein
VHFDTLDLDTQIRVGSGWSWADDGTSKEPNQETGCMGGLLWIDLDDHLRIVRVQKNHSQYVHLHRPQTALPHSEVDPLRQSQIVL